MKVATCFALLSMAALTLPAQSTVESAIATAGAANAAASMQKLGKASATLFEKNVKALEAGAKVATTVIPETKTAYTAPPVKLSPPPDPAVVKIGMTEKEVLAKFGPPWMKLSTSEGETWSYGTGSETVTLTLNGGKVTAVTAAEKKSKDKEPSDQAVVIIQ